MHTWWAQPTPYGDITVVARAGCVCAVSVPGHAFNPPVNAEHAFDAVVATQFAEYFAGTRHAFDVAVDLSSVRGPFARRVLETLRREVPTGETVTYGELAAMAGRPHAARAVGSAMRHNPVPIIVPCHRVVAAHAIGAYAGELHSALKRALLEAEGALVA
ncbi:MAG: methylated-DNA--[protein]-cysteine S-methyltransferase [Acidimicrobiia bacterium]